jgi:hypothetical protein
MRQSIAYLSGIIFAASSLSTVAYAQSDDIALRSQAYQDCNVEGYLGYGTYEVCVEARYQDLLNQYGQPGDGDEVHDQGNGCSAETRIRPC